MALPAGFSGYEPGSPVKARMIGHPAILQGVGYTLGAASIYLPPAVLLRHRISRMANQELVGRRIDPDPVPRYGRKGGRSHDRQRVQS